MSERSFPFRLARVPRYFGGGCRGAGSPCAQLEGSGDKLEPTDLLRYATAVFDGTTGQLLRAEGFRGHHTHPNQKRNVVKKKFVAAGAALGLAATLIATAAAAAEPVANGPVVFGSDTLQDVLNALANGTNTSGAIVRSTASGEFAASFDATGSTNIQTKSGGAWFGRPNGSGDGVKALSRSIDGQPSARPRPAASRT